MVEFIPPPEPHGLLPPLLACLPTAFASHRPPPALLPLVSPIIRQRLQLATSTSASSSENWLRLLCWDKERADELLEIVEHGIYEPHPSSGEIEVGETDAIKYKRLDRETLRARIVLPEWSLTALYLWCSGGEAVSDWKLAELLPLDSDLEGSPTWSHSITEANESSRGRMVQEAIQEAVAAENLTAGNDDDDDYWAQYDKTPGRSPSHNRSPAPNSASSGRPVAQSDGEYYAQYSEVQPAMDNHDPSEAINGNGESSLKGDILTSVMKPAIQNVEERVPPSQEGGMHVRTGASATTEEPVNQPQPYPPSPANSDAVALLESRADEQSVTDVGIRQHISTTMKSLFRLANSAGMDREEFDRLIQRELEANSIFED